LSIFLVVEHRASLSILERKKEKMGKRKSQKTARKQPLSKGRTSGQTRQLLFRSFKFWSSTGKSAGRKEEAQAHAASRVPAQQDGIRKRSIRSAAALEASGIFIPV
jgi:hypothetical protein